MLRGNEVDAREMTACYLTQIGKDLAEKVHLGGGGESLILLSLYLWCFIHWSGMFGWDFTKQKLIIV